MKLAFTLGDNFNDVTSTQIRELGKNLIEGRKQLVIVPDRFSLTMEERILKVLNLTATFDVDVVSFARFSSKLLQRVQAPQVLSSLGATMVIEKILTEKGKELKCFASTAKTIAFASILFDSIAQLKSCKITPMDLRENVNKVHSSALRLKLNDIALIYEEYEKFLSNEYIDSNNRLALACEIIGDSRDFENTDVYFCNFDSMTERGFDILKILTQKAHSVNIGILTPSEEQSNKSVYVNDIFSHAMALAKNLNLTPSMFTAPNSMPAFSRHILQNVMAINTPKMELESNKQVRLFSAPNPTNEVEFMALDITEKIKNGARYRDIVINSADIERYAPIFVRVFTKYGIPFWIDNPFKLIDAEGTKFLLTALDCVLDNYRTKDMLRFVKSAFCGLSVEDYAVFERAVLRYGIVGERFFSDDKPAYIDPDFDRYYEIKSCLYPLQNLGKNLNGSKTIGEMVSAVKNFFEETALQENLDGLAMSFEEEGDLLRQSISRQNFQKISAVLEQMQNILGGSEISLRQFDKILRSGISTVTISPLPMSVDCVYIGQSLTSVFSNAPYYYISGAVDGNLPAFVADVGLIADHDIMELGHNAISITPSIRQVNARSKASVLQSLALATQQLTILYPVRIGKDECVPASVVDNIAKLFTFHGADLPILFLGQLLEDDSAFGGMARRLAFLWNNDDVMLNAVATELRNLNSPLSNEMLSTCRQYLIARGFEPTLNEIEKILAGQQVESLKNPDQLFFTSDKARVTQIERFFECPYSHFLNYGLKLKEKRKNRPEAVDIGNILHAVFERFGKILRKGDIAEDKVEGVVSKIFDEVMLSKDFSHIVFSGHNDTMLSGLKREAVRACSAIRYQMAHSQYKIRFIETSFGTEGFAPIPEVAVINTNKRIKISGKIDRADQWGNKLRIIDYKTSKRSGKFSLLNLYIGKKIQLFYYMQAILEALELDAGGAYYLPVHREYDTEGRNATPYSSYRMEGVSVYTEANMFAQDDQVDFAHPNSDIVPFAISTSKTNVDTNKIQLSSVKNSSASPEQFAKLLKYARLVLEGAVNDIYNGEIRPLFMKEACEYCKFKAICGKDAVPSVVERRGDFDVKFESFDMGDKDVR